MKIKERYNLSKSKKVGEDCICPSCLAEFKKTNYQQAFCKTKSGTECKDYYWNNVTPNKRNNTTRISPASARFMNKKRLERLDREDFNPDDYEHPFSSEALGQD